MTADELRAFAYGANVGETPEMFLARRNGTSEAPASGGLA